MTSARIITGAAVQRVLVSSAAGLGERCRVLARYTGEIIHALFRLDINNAVQF